MIAFGGALVVVLLATPCVVWLAHRWRLIDVPNHRSSHVAPVPRGGGIAVAVAAFVGLVSGSSWEKSTVAVAVGAAVLGATGLLDDRVGLRPLPRLGVQLAAPAIVAMLVIDGSVLHRTVAIVVGAVIAAGYVNAYNFMDGINGISGIQAAIAGLWIAVVAHRLGGEHPLELAGLAIAGASVGFLPYNVPRARIFLGDVGSYFVGFWLAATALLLVDADAPVLVVIAPFLLYLLDTSTVLVKRAMRGASLTEAHREHAYQRLVSCGLSHTTVASICAACSLLCCALMYAVVDAGSAAQVIAAAGCVALVSGYLALPAVLTSRAARATGRGVPT